MIWICVTKHDPETENRLHTADMSMAEPQQHFSLCRDPVHLLGWGFFLGIFYFYFFGIFYGFPFGRRASQSVG